MEGRGPYRIYDPGGSVPPGEASAAFERLVEENSRLKEKMQGIKMLGKADPALCPQASSLQPATPAGMCLHPCPPPPSFLPCVGSCPPAVCPQNGGSIPSPESPAPRNHEDRTQNTLRD